MALETATYISDLNSSNPDAADVIGQGDDHLRLVKSVLKSTFTGGASGLAGAVTVTHTELNRLAGVSSGIQSQLDLKAPLASPTFTGTVVLPSTTSIGSVDSTEIGYVNGVTSAIQTQLDAKLAIATAGRWTLLETLTASASPTRETSVSLASYSVIMCEFLGLIPSTGGTAFWIRTSTDGTNYDAGASDYEAEGVVYAGGGASTITTGGASKIIATAGFNVGGTYGICGVLYLYTPSLSQPGYMTWQIAYPYSGGGLAFGTGGGRRVASADVTNIRFLFSSGNITSGSIRVYGR